LTTGGIDDLNTKYFVERGAMGVRRVLKKDMKRIAKATGGKNHNYILNTCKNYYFIRVVVARMTKIYPIIFRG